MKRAALSLAVACIVLLGFSTAGIGQDDAYYARCNLKVLKGNQITWVNWQASPSFIPAGTKLRVTPSGSQATIENAQTGETYTLDIGAEGNAFLEKFVSKRHVDIGKFPAAAQSSIRAATAKVGMTKEQVYMSMGPPAKVAASKTHAMTYEDIMNADLWIYARRRFGKDIGVEFDHATQKVIRTEGIWGQ